LKSSTGGVRTRNAKDTIADNARLQRMAFLSLISAWNWDQLLAGLRLPFSLPMPLPLVLLLLLLRLLHPLPLPLILPSPLPLLPLPMPPPLPIPSSPLTLSRSPLAAGALTSFSP